MLASAGLLFAIVGPSLMAADLQRAAEESKRWSPLEESSVEKPCGNLKTISMMDLGPVSTFAGAIDDLTRGRLFT